MEQAPLLTMSLQIMGPTFAYYWNNYFFLVLIAIELDTLFGGLLPVGIFGAQTSHGCPTALGLEGPLPWIPSLPCKVL